jgi:Helicase conserved C-terminal domain
MTAPRNSEYSAVPTPPTEIRRSLVERFRLDLWGPGPSDVSIHSELLDYAPSRWYLTGFLVPRNAPPEQREGDADTEGDLDSGDDAGGSDDQTPPDKASARRAWRPSSLGLSFLLAKDTSALEATVTWGDYTFSANANASQDETGTKDSAPDISRGRWCRTHRVEIASLNVSNAGRFHVAVPQSSGLVLDVLVRPVIRTTENGDEQFKSVSVFLVNDRDAREDRNLADEAFAFQAHLAISSSKGIHARHDMHGLDSDDWDERVADLHYRDIAEFAVGHNTAADWDVDEDGICREVSSCCMPLAPVTRVVPNENITEFELSMEALGGIDHPAHASTLLSGVVSEYRRWITSQKNDLDGLITQRREIATLLLADAEAAAARIADGIACLSRPEVLEAFVIANRAVARAGRRRFAQLQNKKPEQVDPPRWRPFQLAFFLLNLRGIVEPKHPEREIVDLLFFPTGGGKTEAYLGLAAFTIAYRRITNPGLGGAGLSVLMRYTLRLLTLDQLSRGAAVVCALELERLADSSIEKRLGAWPIEIGLWVGRAATPNHMGRAGETDSQRVAARTKVLDYKKNSKKRLPVPLRECPWCGTAFTADSFELVDDSGRANATNPTNLKLMCLNRACDFHASRGALPILTVDEPIYRRLPAFLIATVDKFAGMPWTGEIAGFFGGTSRYGPAGFYGPTEPHSGEALAVPLPPPDLIVQDELHLISGPLGTMVGLYETAIDHLSSRETDGKRIRPKVIVSTATVRRAQDQVLALFGRRETRIFPPPGPDRGDSFFAKSLPLDDPGGRHYLGVAVPGGSPKVLFLRAAVTLMASAQTRWEEGRPDESNPADPYMTLLAYFNALRELGGARRIVEEEIIPRLRTYDHRVRSGEPPVFKPRNIKSQPLELTSRVPTEDVAEAKRRLASVYKGRADKDSVDVALATNMISVGLDITRLGLMLVSGQPKTAAEYIQATSRVGRDPQRPGLVVVLLNVNKPRDRSHYEHFLGFHSTFYRNVEATSVTPFSPRALDRGLAAVVVALARLGLPEFTPNKGAALAQQRRGELDAVAEVLANRAASHKVQSAAERTACSIDTRQHAARILDNWAFIARDVAEAGADVNFGYQKEAGVVRHLLYDILDNAQLEAHWESFRTPRSLRDVEPPVLIKIKTPDGRRLAED